MENKDIKYINKDFSSFKEALIDYAKTYFPNTYNDFSPTSPGTMFIDLASYVGDVLSFYQDNQLQENFIQYAKEKENLLTLSYMLGYKPKITTAANVMLDVYQQLPAVVSGSNMIPDYNYCLIINEGVQIQSNTDSNVFFYTENKLDFSISSSLNPTELTVYSTFNNKPQYYLLKKQIPAISGKVKTYSQTFGSPTKFSTINLEDTNIIKILSIVDSDGNKWDEVPFLAQETIFDNIQNSSINDPNYSQYIDTTPYLLKLKKVPRRFVTRFKSDNTCEIQFGSGVLSLADETVIPNTDNIGIGNNESISKIDIAYDPSNFTYTSTYGIAPSNTTLTIEYLVGGGVSSNVSSNTLTKIFDADITFNNTNLDNTLSEYVIDSLAFNNSIAATGGKDGDTLDEIRQNAIASFPTQLRAVTKEDYIIRVLSLPQEYGSVSKVYIEQNSQLNKDNIIDNNPLALNMYVLSSNQSGQLTQASYALKENIKTYISQYKMLTDAVNINDAFIINIGVKFDIVTLPGFNSREVLLKCIETLKNYFNIDKWQINQPIILSDLYPILSGVKGVQNIMNISIENKVGESLGYSKYGYDIKSATVNNVVYPSMDPSIFEIKYSDNDILRKIVNI